jgi:hypothetical protein
MSWLITPAQKTDPDALAYLAEVERADGQALESGTRDAVIAFVTGCKTDGIWTAIKTSCILAGARTLAGALVPLVGTAPTNFNFVSGDYNRKTGLVGNGSTKYLNSNRNNNQDPQDNNHCAVYTSGAASLLGMVAATGAGANTIGANIIRNRSFATTSYSAAAGFIGTSRNNSSLFVYQNNQVNATANVASETPQDSNVALYRIGTFYGNARLAFYSIGESLDLALLDARVTTLIQAIDAAI